MNPQVIIVGQEDDPTLNRLLEILRICQLNNIIVIHKYADFSRLNEKEFIGFLIFCLPSTELKKWSGCISKKYKNNFKVYFYDSILEKNLKNSIILNFDFVIVNENSDSEIADLLFFLKNNYWKKIPDYVLKLNGKQISILTRRIINTFEIMDNSYITLKKISQKLKISPQHINEEIKSNFKLNFYEFKQVIEMYYRNNFPDK